MPPPRNRYEDDELFEAPLFEGAEGEALTPMSADDERALFEAPLFDNAPAPMGPPAPPAPEPDWMDFLTSKEGWQEMGKGATAALQGATLNLADDVAPKEWAPYIQQAAEEYPVAHGVGQMVPGIAASVYAGPGLAAQAGAQAALSGASSYFDRGNVGEAFGEAIGGGIAGAVGKVAGDVIAPGLSWAGAQAKKLAPGMFRESVELADPMGRMIVHRGAETAEDMAGGVPMTTTQRGKSIVPQREEIVPVDLEIQRGMQGIDEIESAPMLDTTKHGAVPVRDATVRPVELEDADPLAELLPRGPASWPPDMGTPKLVQGKGGRFAKPVPMELEGPVTPGRLRGVDAPETPTLRPWPPPINKAPMGPAEPLPFDPGEMRYADLLPQRGPTLPAEPIEPPIMSFDMAPAAPAAPPPSMDDGMWSAARAATYGAGKLGAPLRAGMDMLRSPSGANTWANQAGRAVGEAAWETGAPYMLDRKVNAQDDERVAYATPATTNYALSAVLSSGSSGLSPEDEATLTRAVVQGDAQAMRAADFRLRMQNPAYARAIERELRSYNEGDY